MAFHTAADKTKRASTGKAGGHVMLKTGAFKSLYLGSTRVKRGFVLLTFSMFLGSLSVCLPAKAQPYPAKTIRFISPGTPGSTTDIMPRLLAPELAKRLEATVFVDNKAGGSGMISAQAMAAAPADGATLYLSTVGSLCIAPHVLAGFPLDLKEYLPISLTASLPLILVVSPKLPVSNVQEFAAWLKANPDKATYGSAGAGSTSAIAAAVFGKAAGAKVIHVPFRTMQLAADSIMKGELTFLVSDIGVIAAKVKEGALRPLAASTAKRSALMPDVPTFAENGYPMDITLWYAVFMKTGTPAPLVERMTKELSSIMSTPEIETKWRDLGLEPGKLHGADFAKYYQEECRRWAEILPTLGIKE
jgi:tripartite-type tricarboxylate transporter receptor subunit TctC